MSDWPGTLAWDVTPNRPNRIEEGSRIVVRTIEGDTVWIVDEVSEPDVDGVIRAVAHVVETHETAPQSED